MAPTALPKQYKACVYDAPGENSVKIEMRDMPEPGPGEVLIHLYISLSEVLFSPRGAEKRLADQSDYFWCQRTHSGVCHSDLGIMENSVTLKISQSEQSI